MDSFEWNKLIGALLGVVFIVFSVSLISDAIFTTHAPETPGYAIVVPEGGGEAQPAEQEPESVLPLLASADPSAGENVFKRCQACHTPEQGGPNKVGPNLWGVVDRPVASHEGFSYSSAMQEFAQGGEVTWTYENLDHFLLDPRGFIPGTAMAFAGLKNIEDRANVIAYLRTLAEEPAPLPEAAPAEGEGGESGEAPAEGGEEAAPADGEAQAAPLDEGGEGADEGAENAPADTQDTPPADEAPADEDAPSTPQGGEDESEDAGQEPAPAE